MPTIRELVDYYLKEFPDEQPRLAQLLDLLDKFDDSELKSRENSVGHITASSWIVNPRTRKVLLIFHKQHKLWLPPGGHFEDTDNTPLAVAIRKAREETGLTQLTYMPYHYNSAVPIDIDTHLIHTEGEPEHYHHDFRFLFFTDASEDAVLLLEEEAQDYHWQDICELRRFDSFKAVADKIERSLSREVQQHYFYDKICRELIITRRAGAIVVAHILPNVLEYLSAIENLANIIAVIPKPKSIVPNILDKVRTRFYIWPITREDLTKESTITSLMDRVKEEIIIFDIGGWFAPVINQLAERYPGRILGVIEDTENGHQKYEALLNLKVPVVSVARSPLKEFEDFLVGQSIVFSADAILRDCGYLIQYMNCSVLGYGKIGRSIAHHLLLRGIKPNVFDPNPIRRLDAYNHLCNIPSYDTIISSSDVIFSATGQHALNIEDFRRLKNGCFIFSVTSSDDEFDLSHLDAEYKREQIAPHVDRYYSFINHFHLVNKGNAVNFIHKPALGCFIDLVRAEMLVAYKLLTERCYQPGIHFVEDQWREKIASIWLSTHERFEGCPWS